MYIRKRDIPYLIAGLAMLFGVICWFDECGIFTAILIAIAIIAAIIGYLAWKYSWW